MAGRGAFNTRIGFIMAAVGSAVGLGNLYRFPQQVSQNGGAAFVLVYLVLLFLIGLPALMAEFSLGRNRRRDAVGAFRPDAKGRSYRWIGYLFMFSAVLLLSYYSVIAGHAMRYLVESGTAPYFDDPAGYYGLVQNSFQAVIYHALFMIVTMLILIRGVSEGIEKANLIMMPILFASVIAIAIYGLTRTGATDGIRFYVEPDFGELTAGGFGGMATLLGDAAGQTFFSIGLGLGTMLTYSSYMNRQTDLQSTGMTIGLADTGVAVIAGFMVFPLLFGLGLGALADDGNGLFVALPAAFAAIGGTLGGVFAFGFFLLLVFAALSSALSILEVPVAHLIDRDPKWTRPRAVLLMGLLVYLAGLPSALRGTWLAFANDAIGPLLLLGGLLLAVYVGWIDRTILGEMRISAKRDWSRFWTVMIRYPLPVVLSALFVFSVVGLFL